MNVALMIRLDIIEESVLCFVGFCTSLKYFRGFLCQQMFFPGHLWLNFQLQSEAFFFFLFPSSLLLLFLLLSPCFVDFVVLYVLMSRLLR